MSAESSEEAAAVHDAVRLSVELCGKLVAVQGELDEEGKSFKDNSLKALGNVEPQLAKLEAASGGLGGQVRTDAMGRIIRLTRTAAQIEVTLLVACRPVLTAEQPPVFSASLSLSIKI